MKVTTVSKKAVPKKRGAKVKYDWALIKKGETQKFSPPGKDRKALKENIHSINMSCRYFENNNPQKFDKEVGWNYFKVTRIV